MEILDRLITRGNRIYLGRTIVLFFSVLLLGTSSCFFKSEKDKLSTETPDNSKITKKDLNSTNIVYPKETLKNQAVSKTSEETLSFKKGLQELSVPGHYPGIFVEPYTADSSTSVTVVLHGNYDRPQWQCSLWDEIIKGRTWLICPRGVRSPHATLAQDRWTYRGGAKAVLSEITSSLESLESMYPGFISKKDGLLVGFSLGAILAPGVISQSDGLFSKVFFVEGGLDQLESTLPALKRFGISQIGLAMSNPKWRSKAKEMGKRINKLGYGFIYIDMKGAGHNYSDNFSQMAKRALEIMNEKNSKQPEEPEE